MRIRPRNRISVQEHGDKAVVLSPTHTLSTTILSFALTLSTLEDSGLA
jgi:hypothetical protein